MTLNERFKYVFCINLKRRPDRRLEAEQEFVKHGISVHFIDAVDGQEIVDFKAPRSLDESNCSRGDIGCSMSHLAIAMYAKEKGIKEYFVFEDDVAFTDNFHQKLMSCLFELPLEWRFFYLGGNHMGGIYMLGSHVGRIARTFTTHAYAVRNEAIDGIIEVLGDKNEKVDVAIAKLHSRFPSYACKPPLAWQRASYSDILDRHADYEHLKG